MVRVFITYVVSSQDIKSDTKVFNFSIKKTMEYVNDLILNDVDTQLRITNMPPRSRDDTRTY